MNKNKRTLLKTLSICLFVLLGVTLLNYSSIFDGADEEAKNIKAWHHKMQTVEGSFYDANGDEIFAPSKNFLEDTTYLPIEFSYILGYNSLVYDVTGLRKTYSKHLYDDNETGKGGSVQLTVDRKLQKLAYSKLKENNLSGSVIVLNAKNSEILAMAGRQKVDYDINLLNTVTHKADKEGEKPDYQKNWEKYLSTDEFFINPSTMDKKAPGSVYKVVTSASAIINELEDYTYLDTGLLEVDGKKIRNANNAQYGEETLQTALAHSTNTYFASLSLELGQYAMNDIADRFLIGENINLGFATLDSDIAFDGGDHNLAMLGYGQGALAITPLHMAMIGQSIVNNGVMYKPTIVKSLMDSHGKIVSENNRHEVIAQPLKPEVTDKVKELMLGVTIFDDNLRGEGNKWREKYTGNIYCKTGTAQPTDNSSIYNSYFLCMTDDYVILISVKNTPDHGSAFKPWAEEFLKVLY